MDVQNILTDAEFHLSERKEPQTWILEISNWTRQLQATGQRVRTPRIDASDKNERILARALFRHKDRVKTDERNLAWWTDYPEDIQSMWAEEGILEKRKRTDEQWVIEISQWVRTAYQTRATQKIPYFTPRSTAKNEIEKTLGIGFANLKRKAKAKDPSTPWWMPFPQDVQQIWIETRVIPYLDLVKSGLKK